MENEFQSFSDEEMARQAQAGSLPAFDELIARYYRRIYAFVAQSCAVSADAAELTQDTFVKGFRAIGSFNPKRSFAAWLFTIARRKLIDRYRAAAPPCAALAPDLPGGDSPAEELARAEERQNLWDLARCLLPEIQFQALWLKYAEELSIEDIARVLRKTRTHVKVLLFRARQTLGKELESARKESREFVAGGHGVLAVKALPDDPSPRTSKLDQPAEPFGLPLARRKGMI